MARLLASAVLLLLAASCAREEFFISSEALRLEKRDDVSRLELLMSFSDMESSYSATVTSPSSLLVWEAPLEKGGDGFFHAWLDITPGASFEKGGYDVSVLSSSGAEAGTEVFFSHDAVHVFVDADGCISSGGYEVEAVLQDGSEKKLSDGESADGVVGAYVTDLEGNRFYFTLSGRPSP